LFPIVSFFLGIAFILLFQRLRQKGNKRRTPFMYNNNYSTVTNKEELKRFIADNPFGSLISNGDSLKSTPIMLLLKEINGELILQGHLARYNTQWQDLEVPNEVLVVFSGPNHDYISPRYYTTQQNVVPTWDYEMVQVRGIPKIILNPSERLSQMTQLVNSAEASVVASSKNCPFATTPWELLPSVDQDYLNLELRDIVVFTISVVEMEGRFKLSQNKSSETKGRIQACLQATGSELSLHRPIVYS